MENFTIYYISASGLTFSFKTINACLGYYCTVTKALNLQKILSCLQLVSIITKAMQIPAIAVRTDLAQKVCRPAYIGKDVKHFTNLPIYSVQEETPGPVSWRYIPCRKKY